jgi:hypothetical protein
MAREHARILCSIWRPGDDFRDRSPEAQRLYFLIVSQRELNNAGVVPLMVNKWSRCSAGTTAADIEIALAELEEHRYVVVDRDTEELLVRTFIRNDGVARQPNVLKSALRLARQIESASLRRALAFELVRLDIPAASDAAEEIAPDVVRKGSGDPSGNPSSNPSLKPSSTPEPNPSSAPESNPSPSPAGWGGGRGRGGGNSSEGGQVEETREDALRRPSERCKAHASADDPPPCGRCGAARRAAERWDADQADAAAAARARNRTLIDGCPDCDDNGMRDFDALGLSRCAHPSIAAAAS